MISPVEVTLTDLHQNYRLTLRNGVLIHRARPADATTPGATVTTTKTRLLQVARGRRQQPRIDINGEQSILDCLLGVLDTSDPSFNIITP